MPDEQLRGLHFQVPPRTNRFVILSEAKDLCNLRL